jgi:predicted DNA-binding transcriptional regulator AlpA
MEAALSDDNPLQVFNRPDTLKLLGMSDRTFDRLEKAGDAPPKTQLSRRRVGYRASDLAAWLDARRQQKTA